MMQTILVGIAAGIAAALMFLAPIGGTVLAFPLFILTGLPVGLAGLGWGVRAGAVAVVAGTLTILVALQALAAAAFLLLFAVPAFWVARLALRSRPGATPEAPREWYPLGSMLVHLAIAVAIGVVFVGILIGFDRATMAGEITQALVELFSTMRTTGTPPTPAELTPFVEFYLAIMPFSVTAILVFMLTFDLWLAAVVARASGRLQRPREKLWGVDMPNRALVALAGVTLLAFLPGAARRDRAGLQRGARRRRGADRAGGDARPHGGIGRAHATSRHRLCADRLLRPAADPHSPCWRSQRPCSTFAPAASRACPLNDPQRINGVNCHGSHPA